MSYRHILVAVCVAALAVMPRGAMGAKGRDRPYLGYVLATAEAASDEQVEQIWRLAENVLEPHDPAPGPHRLVITRATLRRLRALNISVRVERTDVQAWIDGLYREADKPTPAPQAAATFGPFFSRVRPLDSIYAYMDELATLSQGRASVVVLGQSFQGRDIKAMRISAGAGTNRPAIIVIGTQHAREWASPVVTMGLMDALVRQYDSDPQVKRVVDNLEIYINPVNNPDGYVATFNGRRLQRRNMNSECNVDLNRNYDTAWGQGVGWSCDSDTFPGAAPFSESESQAIQGLVESLARPALLIDYHSTAAQVMIPFAFTMTPAPNLARNRQLCQLYSSALQSVHGTHYPARPGFELAQGAGGGAFDWFRATHAESIVVELGGGAGFSISNQQIIPFAEENFVAWLAVAQTLVDQTLSASAPTSVVGASALAGLDAVPAPAPAEQTGCAFVPQARTSTAVNGLFGLGVLVVALALRRRRAAHRRV